MFTIIYRRNFSSWYTTISKNDENLKVYVGETRQNFFFFMTIIFNGVIVIIFIILNLVIILIHKSQITSVVITVKVKTSFY